MTSSATARYGELNSYDLIKFLALVIMTCDHIGAYLYPDELWWRAIGRITFPVWFFLIGYSTKHSIRSDLWLVALLMIPLNPATAIAIFPLNALISIIIARLLLNMIDNRRLLHTQPLTIWMATAIFGLSSSLFIEYGSFALMYACLGYISRHQLHGTKYKLFYLLSYASFVGWMALIFEFDIWQLLFALIGMAAVCLYLYSFTIMPLSRTFPKAISEPTKYLSRNSLYYYAIHRAALQAIAAIWLIEPEAIQWLRWFDF